MIKTLKMLPVFLAMTFFTNVYANDQDPDLACKGAKTSVQFTNNVFDFKIKSFYGGAVISFKYNTGSCASGSFFPFKIQPITFREIRVLNNLPTDPVIKINQSYDVGFVNVLAIVPEEFFAANKAIQVRLRFGDQVDPMTLSLKSTPLSIYNINIEQVVDDQGNTAYKFSSDTSPLADPKCLILTRGSYSLRNGFGLGFSRTCGSNYGLVDAKKAHFIKNSCRRTLAEVLELLKTESKCSGTDTDNPNIYFVNYSSDS
jgi:hypothetical protein